MSTPLTTDQRKSIFFLLPTVLKTDKDQRKMMVRRYTKDAARSSVNDLTFSEANKVIENYGGKPYSETNWAFFDFDNPQHRKILSLCHDLDWTKYDTNKKKHIVDTLRLSNWLKSIKSPVRKALKKQLPEELTKTINSLEFILAKSL